MIILLLNLVVRCCVICVMRTWPHWKNVNIHWHYESKYTFRYTKYSADLLTVITTEYFYKAKN